MDLLLSMQQLQNELPHMIKIGEKSLRIAKIHHNNNNSIKNFVQNGWFKSRFLFEDENKEPQHKYSVKLSESQNN